MKNILISFFSLFIFFSCNNNKAVEAGSNPEPDSDRVSMIRKIKSLENEIDTKQAIDYRKGAALTAAYLDFFNHFSSDADAPDYLFKAADNSMNLKQGAKALELFKKVSDRYPGYKKASFALFLQGFIYETQLQDSSGANKIYRQVIKTYPHTKIAEDARACISNMGKSDQELIKEFEKKNQGKH